MVIGPSRAGIPVHQYSAQSDVSGSRSRRSPAAPAPKFGGATAALANVFKPVTEQFIYSFLSQDMAILWPPRAATSLVRGREAYNVETDPAYQNKSWLTKKIHHVKKNIHGMNWSNAAEELNREVETGPGLLVFQSVTMGLASIALVGKACITLGRSDLKDLTATLRRAVRKNPALNKILLSKDKALPSSKELMQAVMNDRLSHHFSSGSKQALPAAGLLKDSLDAEFLAFIKEGGHKTYGDALKGWITKWNDHQYGRPKNKLNQAFFEQREKIETIFHRLTHWFNDTVAGKNGVDEIGKVTFKNVGRLPEKSQNVSHVLEAFRKYRDFMDAVVEKATKSLNAKRYAGLISPKNNRERLIETSQFLMKRMITMKFFTGALATLLAGWSAVKISQKAQAGKIYPANRHVQFKNPQIMNGFNQSRPPAFPIQNNGFRPAIQSGQAFQHGGVQ